MYKFKVYMLSSYTYIWQSDDHRVLATTSIMPHNYRFFFVVRTFMISSLSNFQVYNTVSLAVVTMGYIRCPELIQLITGSLCHLTNIPLFSSSQLLVITTLLCFYKFGFFRFHVYVKLYSICLSLSDLISLSIKKTL